MKFSSFVIAIAAIAFLTACSSGDGKGGGGKKVVVFSSGKMQHDAATNNTTINFEPGNRHEELEITLTGSDKAITVKTSAGDKTYDIADGGLYLINLKADTIIGSIVNFGGKQRTNIGSEELDYLIDSTKKLMTGEGASDAKKTYFLPPNSVKKISTNLSATVLSPYKNIPYEVTPDEKGNAPEFYKFFTNSQKRETLKDLIDRLSK